MLRFKHAGVSQVLVGLDRVGITGLGRALKKAAGSGLTDREAIVDLLMDSLEEDNYIPDRLDEAYRTALWREYLRHMGEEIRHLYSEIEVTVRGGGGKRDEFVANLESVLEKLELKPLITYAPGGETGPEIQLEISGETIVSGYQGRRELEEAVRKSISGW